MLVIQTKRKGKDFHAVILAEEIHKHCPSMKIIVVTANLILRRQFRDGGLGIILVCNAKELVGKIEEEGELADDIPHGVILQAQLQA